MYQKQRISVVIPALDEAASIGIVIKSLIDLKNSDYSSVIDEIIVCDNGSKDNTALLAKTSGADVVYELERGYGAACLKALAEIKYTDIIVFVDADRSVVVDEVFRLLDEIINGHELVIGSRTKGQCQTGSLTPQQIIGNHLASKLMQYLWQYPVSDLGPFRAIRFDSLKKLDMRDRHYGWTVEMQVKAIQQQLNISEVAVSSIKRLGRSKISGTIRGTLSAGYCIFDMIFRLWWQEKRRRFLKPKLS